MYSTVSATLYSPSGSSIWRTVSSKAESSFTMLLSTRIRARRTLSLRIIVPLVSTETFAFGACWSRVRITSSMIASKSGCMVGSPLPAKVMTSGGVPAAAISSSFWASSRETSSRRLKRAEQPFSVQPHSQ